MPWSDTLPSIVREAVPGWFNAAPAPPSTPQTGWWAGIDLDDVITIQFVTELEFQALKQLGAIMAWNVDRSLVLKAVRTMALARGLTVTMNMGLQGIYFLSENRDIGVNRVITLANVRQMNFSQLLAVNANMQLGHVVDLGATNQLWNVNRSMSFQHIVPLDFARSISFNPSLAVLPIHVVDFVQTLTVNRSMDLVLIPNKVSYVDTFNRANVTPLGPNWTKRYQSTATTDLKIVSNGVTVSTTSRMVVCSYDSPLATADQEIVMIINGSAYGSINNIVMGIRGDTTKMGVYANIPWSGATSIRMADTSWAIGSTGTAFTTGQSGSSGGTSFTTGQKWRLRGVGDLYELHKLTAADVITGTNPYCSWNDTGQITDRSGRLVSFGLNSINSSTMLFDQFNAKDV